MKTVSYWITTLALQPHPEGGYYRETYRSPENIAASAISERYGSSRSFSTAIYFLLEAGSFSAFHRLKSDEIWFYHEGLPIDLHLISPTGELSHIKIGSDPENGEMLHAIIPNGYWFGGGPAGEAGYSLISCTVAPGFDYGDFELADRSELMKLFPKHIEIIESFTR